MQTLQKLIDKPVVVRSDQAGVYYGILKEIESVSSGLYNVVLARASLVWSWEGALATGSLAYKGLTGGNIEPEIELAPVGGCCSVLACTPEAWESICTMKRWTRPEGK